MGTKDYPDFDGWTVEQDKEHHAFLFSKPMAGLPPFPDGSPRENLTVYIAGGPDSDPQITYDRGRADAYGAELACCPADDKALVQERFDQATKQVNVTMVVRNIKAGAPLHDYGIPRLMALGVEVDELHGILAGLKEG